MKFFPIFFLTFIDLRQLQADQTPTTSVAGGMIVVWRLPQARNFNHGLVITMWRANLGATSPRAREGTLFLSGATFLERYPDLSVGAGYPEDTGQFTNIVRNCQIETDWNWAGFFTEGLETRWDRFGQFLNDL